MARRDVVPDAEWSGCRYYDATRAVAGFDDIAFCFEPVPGPRPSSPGSRLPAGGGPGLSPRERARVRAAHAAVDGLLGGPLARFAEPGPAALPWPARRVVRCLLEGDSDKQAAARLGLSPHTVRGYTRQVYGHFGVAGRAELLARRVRRGWGGRAVWADDPPAGPPHDPGQAGSVRRLPTSWPRSPELPEQRHQTERVGLTRNSLTPMAACSWLPETTTTLGSRGQR